MSTISIQQTFSENHEIDLSGVLNLLWSRKWFILFISSLVLSLGVLYSFKQKPQYRTDVLLQVEDKKQNNAPTGGLSRKLDLAPSSENTAATHSALIQSRFILEPVVQALGLDIHVFPKKSRIMRFLFPGNNKQTKIRLFETATKYINKPFTLVKDKPNHLKLYNAHGLLELQGEMGSILTNKDQSVTLQVTALNPENSQYTLIKRSNAEVIQSLLGHLKIKDLGGKEPTGVLQVSLSGSNPHQMIKILDAIAKEAQQKDTAKKSLEASKALTFLYQQLPLAKESLDKAETDLNLYRATSGKIDIKLQSQSLLAQLEDLDKQLSALRVSQIDMLQRYTDSHPFLIGLIKQTQGLELKRHRLEKLLKTLPASDQIAVNLMRDVEVKNSLYLILLNKIQELEFVKAGTVSNVRILSYAKLPDDPLPNHQKLIWIGSFLLGLALSFIIIFMQRLLTTHVNDPHWVERNLNLVNLAIIPYCKEQNTNTKKFKNKSFKSLPLLAQTNPRNLTIEALRSLRTSLQVTLASAPNNIVSILGISPGVGKTFISSNLAWLLAVSGKRILLVDGDFRRGVLHNNFNLEAKPGLVDYLSNNCALNDALKNAGHPNLTVLPRGSFISDPSEMIMSKPFKALIHTLSAQYDMVLIDTAPVLLVTDGTLIAGLSGTNYLVMGSSAHHPSDVVMVMKRLANAGVQVHGSIFNFFKTESRGQRYTSYNGYYHDEKEIN